VAPVIAEIRSIITTAFLILGALFMLVAAIGVIRMPDLLMRMQAATKASALGAGLMFTAGMVYFWLPAVTMRFLAATVFIFLTLPLAAHLLARASYLSGVEVWPVTQIVLPEPHGEEDAKDEEEAR
jgi:multicomponent Na+:H+ antiporter subunit G